MVFLCLSGCLCILLCAYYLFSCHWILLRSMASSLLLPCEGVLALLHQNSLSRSLSSPTKICSSPLLIFETLCKTYYRIYLSLLNWEDQNWTQHSRDVSLVLCGVEWSPVSLLVMLFLMQSRRILAFFATDSLFGHVQRVGRQDSGLFPKSFFLDGWLTI